MNKTTFRLRVGRLAQVLMDAASGSVALPQPIGKLSESHDVKKSYHEGGFNHPILGYLSFKVWGRAAVIDQDGSRVCVDFVDVYDAHGRMPDYYGSKRQPNQTHIVWHW